MVLIAAVLKLAGLQLRAEDPAAMKVSRMDGGPNKKQLTQITTQLLIDRM